MQQPVSSLVIAVACFSVSVICATTTNTTLTTATSVSTSTTCSATPVQSQSSSLNCGVKGRLVHPSTPIDSFNATTASACGYACATEPECVSFDFDSTGTCDLFNQTLNNQGLTNKNIDYGDLFYNVSDPQGIPWMIMSGG